MKNHLKVLGIVYLTFGFVCGIAVFFFLRTAAVHGPILSLTSIINSLPGFRSVFAFLFTITLLPALIAGFGLLAEKKWARTLAQILGFVNLVNIPLGTMVGIYTIWALMKDEGDLQTNA